MDMHSSGTGPGSLRPGRSTPTGRVELSFPTDERFSMLARLAAAALASSVGFSTAEVDDVRHAIERAWGVAHTATDGDGRLRLRMDAAPLKLRVELTSEPPATPAAGPSDLRATASMAVVLTWAAGRMPAPPSPLAPRRAPRRGRH